MKLEEPCEGRLSSTVPWERKGETPLRDPIMRHPIRHCYHQTDRHKMNRQTLSDKPYLLSLAKAKEKQRNRTSQRFSYFTFAFACQHTNPPEGEGKGKREQSPTHNGIHRHQLFIDTF